jgi:DNA-binding CsgD family transcriptional regulator
VTRGKKVVESNAAFRELPQFFVSGAYGVLRLADDRADDLLQDALAAITVDQSSIVRSIPIASAEHRMSCVAHVIPLRGEARQVFAGTSALIVAAVAGAETSLPAPVLRGLYDLTAAEARLLEDIIAGKTLQQAARSAGTSYETCRSQLKSIFQKTGSRSQIELVRRLAPLTLRPTRQ